MKWWWGWVNRALCVARNCDDGRIRVSVVPSPLRHHFNRPGAVTAHGPRPGPFGPWGCACPLEAFECYGSVESVIIHGFNPSPSIEVTGSFIQATHHHQIRPGSLRHLRRAPSSRVSRAASSARLGTAGYGGMISIEQWLHCP